MLWLRGWLQQASSEGPRCADGSLFRELRLSRQDCQRERYVEPVHPACESEMINVATPSVSSSAFGVTETVPLWLNLKDSSTQKPSVSQDTDYMYEYLDNQDNENDTNIFTSPSSVSTQTISVPTQTVNIIHPPLQTQKHQIQKNETSSMKKNPMMPPSPSSSGFTFFGLPLPSMNFDLWGNSKRKAERKESSMTPNRPSRGRYRSFPPTEPEIHRGGFVPLPRAQSGFVPIADPRLMYEKHETKRENVSKSLNVSSTPMQMSEERPRKSANSTITRVEKIVSKTGKPRTNLREREELSTVPTFNRSTDSSNFNSRKILPDINKINSDAFNATKSSASIIVEESSQETHETSVSTEIYDDKSLKVEEDSEEDKFIEKPQVEIASRIIWTTPKTITTETRKTIIKDIVTAAMEMIPSQENSTKDWDIEISEYENNSTRLGTTTDSYDESDNPQVAKTDAPHFSLSTTLFSISNPRPRETTTMTTRGTSALSALLIPGGQLSSSGPVGNLRPLGRSTITKVASPYLSHNAEQLRERQKSIAAQRSAEVVDHTTTEIQNEAFVIDEKAKVIDDSPLSWYFQHYNDTYLEPYVGIAYSSTAKIDAYSCLFLLAFRILI